MHRQAIISAHFLNESFASLLVVIAQDNFSKKGRGKELYVGWYVSFSFFQSPEVWEVPAVPEVPTVSIYLLIFLFNLIIINQVPMGSRDSRGSRGSRGSECLN